MPNTEGYDFWQQPKYLENKTYLIKIFLKQFVFLF
jgi:hypothetical protein